MKSTIDVLSVDEGKDKVPTDRDNFLPIMLCDWNGLERQALSTQ